MTDPNRLIGVPESLLREIMAYFDSTVKRWPWPARPEVGELQDRLEACLPPEGDELDQIQD